MGGSIAYGGPRPIGRGPRAVPPTQSFWHTFAHRVFAALWVASLVSNIGTWMQNVGAAWLMTSLSPSPLMVALIQTASSLPILLLALPAGALADIVDRRKLLLVSQTWMLLAAAALGYLTLADMMTPWLLLGLSFALGVGSALNAPAWQAIIPELVPHEELSSAIGLGGISFNAARAIGPALGGIVVASAGAGATFVLNAASFLGVMVVLFVWKRTEHPGLLPAERMMGAIRSGLRYVRYAPALRAVMVRTGAFTLGGSAVWAILPLLARHRLHLDADGYGILLAAFGVGAIGGGAALPRLEQIISHDKLLGVTAAMFAAVLAGLGLKTNFALALGLMAIGGVAWVLANSSLNIAAQLSVPAWVQGRALACYQIVQQGATAGGSVLWGFAAERWGEPRSLVFAALAMVAGLATMLRYRIASDDELDLEPAPRPVLEVTGLDPDSGPVLVTIEYLINPESAPEFEKVMRVLEPIRHRDGASFWGLFFDSTQPGRFVEYFLVESWIEHMRQHERGVVSDLEAQDRAFAFHIASAPPVVTHQISARAIIARNSGFFAMRKKTGKT
jgi:MFS family permease